jgi:hypothetical protein
MRIDFLMNNIIAFNNIRPVVALLALFATQQLKPGVLQPTAVAETYL